MTRPMRTGDERANFTCEQGGPQVTYLREEALPAHEADLNRTYVLEGSAGEPALLGFYAVCMGKVTSTDLPDNKGKKSLHAATPAALLAQLATDDNARRGIGAELVADALLRIAALSEQIGCAGVFLHAQGGHPKLMKFYEGIGFRRIGSSAATAPVMWISMRNIRATLAQEAAEADDEAWSGAS